MEKKIRAAFRQALALLLCVAMLLPALPVPAGALESGAEKISTVATEASGEETYVAPVIDLPAYVTSAGKVSQTMEYDCGNGVSGNGEKSYLTVVTGTGNGEYQAYRTALKDAGFTELYWKHIDSRMDNPNRFASYLSPKGDYKVYLAYYTPNKNDETPIEGSVTLEKGELRIIVDTQKDTVEGFRYESTTGETAEPMLVQYGLSISQNGYDNTSKSVTPDNVSNSTFKRNCGALTVIRMKDNSLFIHDGGDIEQWSDDFCREFLQFCRDITGKQEGEKVVINTWFLSHAHTDHFLGFPRFVRLHHDAIDIKNIMYNIDIERSFTTRDIKDIMRMVSGYYPDVRYYKPHTGETIDIQGIKFDVMYTLEDRYLPNAAGELITDYPEINFETGKTVTEYDVGGTYRAEMYETDGKSDFNDTSTVLKVTFENQKTAILYADMNLAEKLLFGIYPDSYLATDIMMVPHHGHDTHPKLAELSQAKIFLYTQHKQAIFGLDGDATTNDYNDLDSEGRYTSRNELRKKYLEMAPYIEADGSKTYWAGNETVCIQMGDTIGRIPADMELHPEQPDGFTVYTREAASFEFHEGDWTVTDGAVSFFEGSASNMTSADMPVQATVTTPAVRMEPVPNSAGKYVMKIGQKYGIMDFDTDNLLLQDHATNTISSVLVKNDGTAGEAFFTANKGRLYLPYYLRDQALWELTNEWEKSQTYPMAKMEGKDANGNTVHTGYFGGKAYKYTMFAKGGLAEGDESWWEPKTNDSYRILQPNDVDLVKTEVEASRSYQIHVEFFDDGSCLIYYFNPSKDGVDNGARFLTCDENGNWSQVVVKPKDTTASTADQKASIVSQVTKAAKLKTLKLRLFRYLEFPNAARPNLKFTGNQSYTVLPNTTYLETQSLIVSNIAVTDIGRRNWEIPFSSEAKVGYYWLQFPEEYAPGRVGDYTVKVLFRNDDGTDTHITSVSLHVVDRVAKSGSLDGSNEGVVPQYAGLGATVQGVVNEETIDRTMTIVYDGTHGEFRETVKVTVGMLTNRDGKYVDTSVAGEYTDLILTYKGIVLDQQYKLEVTNNEEALNYPAYPGPGSVQVNKTGTALGSFSQTGTANIQLSATGKPQEKGVDLIVVMDLSGSMKNTVDSNADAPTYEQSRVYIMEQALREMVRTIRANGSDVRIAMSDFGDLDTNTFSGAVIDTSVNHKAFFDANYSNNFNYAYEFGNYLNFVTGPNDPMASSYALVTSKDNMSNPSYSGMVIPTIYTGSGQANAAAFVDAANLDDTAMNAIVAHIDENVKKSYGTNYDVGLEYAYQLGYAIQQDNIAKGEDRDLVCIFMSDGAAIQYNYFSGRPQSTSWDNWITGTIENDTIEHLSFSLDNKPAALVELEKQLLKRLKAGSLVNLRHNRNANTSHEVVTKDGDGNDVTDYYFRYYPSKAASNGVFYTYMENHSYDLDWEYLCEIAAMNGLTGFSYDYFQKNKKLTELLTLLTTPNPNDSTAKKDGNGVTYYISSLKSPSYYEEHHYPKYTGEETDLFTILRAEPYDLDMSWDLFAKLAYRNRSGLLKDDDNNNIPITDADGTTRNKNIEDLLRELIISLKPADRYTTVSPYGYFYNPDGRNWWAEAIKGDPSTLYPVINKYAHNNSSVRPFTYYGDVRNNFDGETTYTTNEDGEQVALPLSGKDYIGGYRGLGMDLYTISFSVAADRNILASDAETVLKNIASGQAYFYSANNQKGLTEALKSIVSSASKSASQAWYMDTMGPEFDLSTEKTVKNAQNQTVQVNANPTVRVLEYTLDAEGERTGEYIVRETITFKGGKVATSDQIYDTQTDESGNITQTYPDIWDDATNMINGRFARYNANKAGTDVDVDGDGDKDIHDGDIVNGSYKIDLTGDGKPDYPVPAESFFWTIGIIGETEMVLEYQVYLTGSVEGARNDDGVTMYPTNTSARLTYTNYLDVPNCHKDTISPAFPWGDPIVGHGFYLVDGNGNPLKEDGKTGTFLESVKLTDITYEQYNKLVDGTVTASELLGDLADSYWLYDPTAQYTLTDPAGEGYWTIQADDTLKNTTYVTNYGGQPTNALTSQGLEDPDLTRSVVWFALEKRSILNPDQVVIDYGLPVKIDVLGNDQLQEALDVFGICAGTNKSLTDGLMSLPAGVQLADTVSGKYGSLTVTKSGDDKNKLVYTPSKMEMDGIDTFTYCVKDGRGRHLFSTVTVIPATTIYYEDNFVTTVKHEYKGVDENGRIIWDPKGEWGKVKETDDEVYQGEHRPGAEGFESVYGYDDAYKTYATHSLGNARKITVTPKQHGTAEFTFWGTGFDVISLSSSDTGFITVQVTPLKDANGKDITNATPINKAVDTYYGYTYQENTETGKMEWKPANGNDILYQVPVMKVEKLTYGQYKAVITVSYSKYFDHKAPDAASGNYDFYLDAIRIYDPANPEGDDFDFIEDTYIGDGEGKVSYQELRNLLITKGKFNALGNTTVTGAVFVDGIHGEVTETDGDKVAQSPATIEDYKNFGPNNEVYLAKWQGVAFELAESETVNRVYLALKAPLNGAAGVVTVYGIDTKNNNAKTYIDKLNGVTISSATDLYFDITPLIGKTVVIANSGDGLLSVTNLKFAYGTNVLNSDGELGYVTMSRQSGHAVLELLNGFAQDEVETDVMGEGTTPVEPQVPGTQPTQPEATEPDVTEPGATEPEATEPEATEPETTEPEATEPDAFNPEKVEVKLSNTSVKVGSQVMVTVTTGEDVAYLTVNGAKVTFFTQEGGQRIWRVRLTAKEVGGMAIRVVACNETGAASGTVMKILEVTDSYTGIGNWLEDLIIRIVSSLTK